MSFIDWLCGKSATNSAAMHQAIEKAVKEEIEIVKEIEAFKSRNESMKYIFFQSAEHIAETLYRVYEIDQDWRQYFQVSNTGLPDTNPFLSFDINTGGFEYKYCVGYQNSKHAEPCVMYIHNRPWEYHDKVYGNREFVIAERYIGGDVAILPQVMDALRELREKGCNI